MMTPSLDQLRRLNSSPVNRLCTWVALFAGLALIADMVMRLNAGGDYQYIRHTAGFAGVAFFAFSISRLYRRAHPLLVLAAQELVAENGAPSLDPAARARLLASIPYAGLARRYAMFGFTAMERGLRHALEQWASSEQARQNAPRT